VAGQASGGGWDRQAITCCPMVRAPARLKRRRYVGGSNMKTDIELQRDVMEELKWETSVNTAHIGVAAKDGIVTLTGYVSSFAEKYEAEQAAKRVRGVQAVVN